jgi:hypothetical protein
MVKNDGFILSSEGGDDVFLPFSLHKNKALYSTTVLKSIVISSLYNVDTYFLHA